MRFYEDLADAMETMDRLGDTTPLTAEITRELLIKAKAGNKAARDKLIIRNTRFVFKKAEEFYIRTVELDQLFSAGIDGLITAIDKFDISKENSFLTYARFFIEEAIKNAIKNTSKTMHITHDENRNLRKIQAINTRLQDEGLFNTKERLQQIAYEVELPVDEVKFLLKSSRIPDSYDVPFSEESSEGNSIISNIEDTKYLSPEDEVTNASLKEEEEYIINQLPEKQRIVIRLRFGLTGKKPMTCNEIGKLLNCSKAWISQLEKQALKTLKNSSYAEDLNAYLIA